MKLNDYLHDYQILAKDFLLTHPYAGLFLDVGFGKTLVTLAALSELAERGMLDGGHILIIAPKNIARSTWIDEIRKWGLNVNTKSLLVNDKGKKLTRKKRLELYEKIYTDPPAIYFINRDLVTDLIKWCANNKKPWAFPTVIIDELQGFKSYKSARFKALQKVRPYIRRFIGLTGTPIPNGLMDLWAEIYLMDQGIRLGHNITTYRNTFFRPGRCINNYPIEWFPLDGAEDEIYRRIGDLVISIKNPNLKLPPVTYNDVQVYMDDDEIKQYKHFMKTQVCPIIDDNGDKIIIEASNAGVLNAKLSQMASGALYTDEEHNYAVIHEKKLEQLQYIIDNTNSPVMVAYHFNSDLKEIIRYLTALNYNVTKFDGSPEMVHAWNNNEIPILLLQPQSAGHGLNLQSGDGHTLVWYTLTWSLEEYIQCCGRLYRQGQKNPVVIHHLLTKGTVDMRILNAIKKKDTSEKALMDAVSAYINDYEDELND